MSAQVTPINQRQSMHAHALAYAKLGWHVLPLVPGAKQPLSRLVPNGFHNATRDPDTIERWWAAEPHAGIGVALKASGLVAVDVDLRNDGFATLDDLQAQHGKLESDVHQITGDGGWHIVYAAQLVESLPGKLGRGIDLKADGYICVEPSIHPNGKTYEWEASSNPLDGCIPSTLPGWIRDMARAPLAPSVNLSAPLAPTPRWLDCLAALPAIQADDRDTWLQVGMAIHNERPDAEGFRAWAEWSATSPKFDAKDQSRVWLSFKRRGLSGTTLNTVFAMAQQAGWKNESHTAPVPTLAPDGLLIDMQGLSARAAALRWAVKGVVPENSIGMIYGASGTFKSFIALDYTLHRAYGMPWLGRKTKQAVPVYVAAEGGAGLMKRINAWHQKHGMDAMACAMRVVIAPISLSTEASVLRAAIESAGITPGDIVVDTMSQTFNGEENSAKEVSEFFRKLATELREAFACTVLIVHHTGHGAGDRARGSSAMMANLDFQIQVEREAGQMLATVTCAKQKEDDHFPPADFVLERLTLGKDEDGEAITSLVASHANQPAQLLQAVDQNNSSRLAVFLNLVRELGNDEQIRKQFYLQVEGNQSAKQKAYVRVKESARAKGLIVVKDGGQIDISTEQPQ